MTFPLTFALSLFVLHLILTTVAYIRIDKPEMDWFMLCSGLGAINIVLFLFGACVLIDLLGGEEGFHYWWSDVDGLVLAFECILGASIFLYWGLLGPRGTNFGRNPLSSYSDVEIDEVLENLIKETQADKSIEWHEKEPKHFWDWRKHCSFWVNVSGDEKKLYRIFRFDRFISRLFGLKPYWELWITENERLNVRPISSREFLGVERLITAVVLQINERYECEKFNARKAFLNSVGARLDEEILEELGI